MYYTPVPYSPGLPMGHIKYGPPPTSRRWREVVALIAGGAAAAQVAAAAVHAGEKGLRAAANDPGVVEAYWLLVRVPLAARAPAFTPALRALGITVPADLGIVDLGVGYTAAVDARMAGGRTDLAEVAQAAGVETLWAAPGPRAQLLYGAGPVELRKALAALATPKRFGDFARPFFARLAYKVLAYLLSRIVPLHVGDGRAFRTLADAERFADALRTHCHEATHHHARFAGDWYSLHRFQAAGDISRDETQRFLGHAMTKLTGEFRRREGTRGT